VLEFGVVVGGILLVVGAAKLGYPLIFRGAVRRYEAGFRTLRAAAQRDLAYEPVAGEASDADLRQRERWNVYLESVGLHVLAEMREVSGTTPLRWFRDDSGTVFGWFAEVAMLGRADAVALLLTRSGDRVVATQHAGNSRHLAQAPHIAWEHVPRAFDLGEALARHRARVGEGERVAISTVEDMQRELAAQRGRSMAWREAHPPDALLEADLRAYLGKDYDVIAPMLSPRLRDHVPRARVV
jgi:hypothetical protein